MLLCKIELPLQDQNLILFKEVSYGRYSQKFNCDLPPGVTTIFTLILVYLE